MVGGRYSPAQASPRRREQTQGSRFSAFIPPPAPDEILIPTNSSHGTFSIAAGAAFGQAARMIRFPSMTAFVLACLLSAGCSHSRAVESKAAIGHPGDDLRARLGLTLPSSEMMVIAYGVAQHHTRSESSVVAWRSGNGVWTIERAGQESSGLLKMEPRAHPITRKTLSSENAERLEKLIAAPDVYQEQVQMGDFPVGGFASTMEIITPKRRRVVQWAGRLTGKLGQVADIVIGRG